MALRFSDDLSISIPLLRLGAIELIASVILVIGIGGAYLQLGNFQLTSVALCTIFGMLMNWILPKQAASEKALEAEKKEKEQKYFN